MTKAVARWAGTKVRFDVQTESGHSVTADEGSGLGDDAGMRPTEMLLGALASCSGVNAALLLKKFNQPYTSLSVEVDGEQEAEWPKRFLRIRIAFVIAWDGEPDQELVNKALDMACNRYCPVDATLTQGTSIEISHREPAQPRET